MINLIRQSGPIFISATILLQYIALPVTSFAQTSFDEFALTSPMNFPSGIVEGPDGAMWFTQRGSKNIGRITVDGVITDYTVLPAGATSATFGEITVGPDANLWFTGCVQSPAGAYSAIGKITTSGVSNVYSHVAGRCSLSGITKGSDGALWFIDNGSYSSTTIVRITTQGQISHPFGSYSGTYSDIVSASNGYIWATNITTNQIVRYDINSGAQNIYQTYNIPTPGSGLAGITRSSDGTIWFTESNANKLGKLLISGVIEELAIPGLNTSPQKIIAGNDGSVWFKQENGNKIGRLASDGTFSDYQIPTPNSGANRLAMHSNGTLWFPEFSVAKIGRLTVQLPPAAPGGLSVASGASVPVDLNWGSVSGATSFNVYRNGVKIASTNASNANYSDRLPVSGVNTYYVTAVSTNGESAPSNSVSVTLPAQYYVSGSMSINELPLPTSPYANISFDLRDGSGNQRGGAHLSGVSSYAINVTNISQNRNYGMDIQYSGTWPQLNSTQTNLPDQFLLKQTTLPIFLANNNATQNYDFTTKRVTVLVKNAQNNPISSQVNISNVSDSFVTNNVDQTSFRLVSGYLNATNYSDATLGQTSFGLFTGGNYRVCATAINICQNFTPNEDMTVVLSPLPTAPVNLSAQSPTQTPVTLSWTAVSGASSYNIYRDGVNVGPSATTSYSDVSAPVGLHTYFVKAVNASGEGAPSNTVSVEVVANQAPVIAQLSGATLGIGGSYAENGSFVDADSTSWTTTVDYGDGSGAQVLPLAGQGFNLGHIYNASGEYTVTVTVTDNQGASSTATALVTVDDITPPVVFGSFDRAPDNGLWYNNDVTITWSASDPDSTATTPSPTVVSTEGANQNITSELSCDPSGNCAAGTATVNLDKSAPTITASLSEQPNSEGWNNGPVTVTFACNDTISGVATCSEPVLVSAEGGEYYHRNSYRQCWQYHVRERVRDDRLNRPYYHLHRSIERVDQHTNRRTIPVYQR